MSRLLLAFGGLIAAIVLVAPDRPLGAAELSAPTRAYVRTLARCRPCGCLRVFHAYHRELRSTYGLGFDPRNYDTTQPYYYLGRMRAYPRYLVDKAGLN